MDYRYMYPENSNEKHIAIKFQEYSQLQIGLAQLCT